MRVLGIDYGNRWIGLAISDSSARVARPLETIEHHGDRPALRAIAELAEREGVELLVLGEPLTLSGERGQAAERVRRFGRRLAAATGLQLMMTAETLTSVEAERRAATAGRGRRRRGRSDNHRLDAVAAQILLQDALDEMAGGKPQPSIAAPPERELER